MAVAIQLSSVRRRVLSPWGALLVLTGAAGIALRVWVYRAKLGTPNADEAVVGLMARHVIHHGELTAFYWGQAYGGTQEALLTVPLFLIAGSSWFALRIVPMALNAVAALLVWRVGRRTIGEPAARVAAGVFWVWPPFVVYQLTHQLGFYASDVVYTGLLLLLALRVVERPDRTRVGLFGLVLGLSFWQTAQIVPIAVPLIGWTIWKQPRCLRQLWLAAPLAILGALPWVIWNVEHGWESLAQPPYGNYTRSLRFLVSPILPMMVGLRAPFSTELLLPKALTYLTYGGLVAAFIYGAFKARRRRASVLYFVVAVFPFIYAISPKTVLALARPRYITVLTPVLALLFSQVATKYLRTVAVLSVAVLVSTVTLYKMDRWFRGVPSHTTNARGLGPRHAVQWVPRDLSPLISALDRLGLDHVYADYWLAYRLDFDTGERIVAVEDRFTKLTFDGGQANPSDQPHVRYRPYEREVRRARHGFVFYRQIVNTIPIVPRLERAGYRRHLVGSFVIYAPSRGP